jgi:hypothetical protein
MKKILSIKNKIMSRCNEMAYEGTPSVLWDALEAQVQAIAEHLHKAQEFLRGAKACTSSEYSVHMHEQYEKHIDIAHALASGDPEIVAALGHRTIPLPMI